MSQSASLRVRNDPEHWLRTPAGFIDPATIPTGDNDVRSQLLYTAKTEAEW
jgi:hypothetical protein